MKLTKKQTSLMEKRKIEISLRLYREQTKNISPSKLCFSSGKPNKKILSKRELEIEKRKSEIALYIYRGQTKNLPKTNVQFHCP